MEVLFETRHPEAAAMHDLAVRRLRFVMRRLTWLVPRAKVSMSDVNGPRGGADKRVLIELKAHTNSPIVVTAIARDWRSALDSALSRAARVLMRNWRRDQARSTRNKNPSLPFGD